MACVSKEFLELQRNARGKADLYFHAYFWLQYLEHLHRIQSDASGQQESSASGKKAASSNQSKDGTASATSIAAPVIS